MKYLIKFNLLFSLLLLASCNKDVSIITESSISKWNAPITEVLFRSNQFANGSSQGILKLQVYDFDDNPISGLQLTATPDLSTFNFVNCTPSNNQGIIYCYFTSTQAATANISLSDGDQFYSTTLKFIPLPNRLSFTRVANTRLLNQTSSGYLTTTSSRKTNWIKDSTNSYEIDSETPLVTLDFSF